MSFIPFCKLLGGWYFERILPASLLILNFQYLQTRVLPGICGSAPILQPEPHPPPHLLSLSCITLPLWAKGSSDCPPNMTKGPSPLWIWTCCSHYLDRLPLPLSPSKSCLFSLSFPPYTHSVAQFPKCKPPKGFHFLFQPGPHMAALMSSQLWCGGRITQLTCGAWAPGAPQWQVSDPENG